MQSIDPKQAERVWSRVMNAQAADAPKTAADFNAGVMQMLLDARQEAALYACLAGKLRGKAQKLLQELCERKRCQIRTLGAVYFLSAGVKACPERGKPVCITCVNESLRQQHKKSLHTAEIYRSFAAQAGCHACVFEKLAKDECENAGRILCVLEACL